MPSVTRLPPSTDAIWPRIFVPELLPTINPQSAFYSDSQSGKVTTATAKPERDIRSEVRSLDEARLKPVS